MTQRAGQSDDTWESCPPGRIQEMVQQRKRRWLTVLSVQIAAGAVVVTMLVWLALNLPDLTRDNQEHHFGGIACSDVQSHAREYLRGELDDKTTSKIRLHLQECDECSRLLEKMKKQSENTRNSGHRRHTFAAEQGDPFISSCRSFHGDTLFLSCFRLSNSTGRSTGIDVTNRAGTRLKNTEIHDGTTLQHHFLPGAAEVFW